jgi:uncharacterized protein (TIGR03437 family)
MKSLLCLTPWTMVMRVWLLACVGLASGTIWLGQRDAQAGGTVVTVSAASFRLDGIAPETVVAAFGEGLATQTVIGTDSEPNTPGIQLPTSLAGTSVRVNGQLAGLFFVSANQINYLIPANTPLGNVNVEVKSGNGMTSTGTIEVRQVAPAIFSANASGVGVPAAVALRVRANGQQSFEAIATFNQTANRFLASPIELGPEGDKVFLVLFLSGIRRAPDPNNDGNVNEFVRVIINGLEVTPAYAGKQGELLGLDQINVELPRGLQGSAALDVIVVVNGFGVSNTTQAELVAPPITSLSWRPLGLPSRVVRAFATIGSYLFAATNQGVFCSGDNGVNWIAVNNGLPPNASILSLLANGSVLYAGLQGGGVCVSTNNGQSWTAINTGLAGNTLTINYLAFFGPTLYAATAGGVCVYNNGQWQALNNGLSTLDSVTLLGFGGRLCVGTRGGGIFALNGTQWGAISNGLPAGAQVLSLANASAAVYAGLNGAGLCVSRNNGQSWTQVGGGLPATATIYSIWLDGVRCYVATAAGIYVSNDNGAMWILLSNGLTNPNIFTIFAIASRLLAGSNGNGVFGAALVTSNTNRLPVAYSQSVALDEDTTRVITLGGLDLDLDPLNYFIQSAPVNGTLTGTAPNVLYTPRADFNGADRFRFIVTDGRGGTSPAAEVALLVNPVNDAPLLNVPGPINVTAGQAVNFNVQASDVDTGQTVTLSAANLPPGALFNPVTGNPVNGNFAWTPQIGGTFTLNFTAADNAAPPLSTTRSVTLTVAPGAGPGVWAAVGSGLMGSFLSFRALVTSGANLFAGTQGNGVYRSSDNGATWTSVNTGLTNPSIVSLSVVGPNVYAGTGGSGLFVTNNNGANWTVAGNGIPLQRGVYTVAASGQYRLAGTDSGLYHSTDGGANWTLGGRGFDPPTLSVNSLLALGNTVYAGTISGFYVSNNNGASWTLASTGLGNGLALNILSLLQRGGTLYAGTFDGVYATSLSNLNWTKLNTGNPNGQPIYGLAGDTNYLFANNPSTVYFSVDGGANWAVVNGGQPPRFPLSLAAANGYVLVTCNSCGFFRALYPVLTGNNPPVLTVPGSQSVAAGQNLSFTISATDADAGQSLTYTAYGLPAGAAFNAATRQFSWTAAAGIYNIGFGVTDNGSPARSDFKTATLTVTGR